MFNQFRQKENLTIHTKFKNPEKNHRFSFSNTHTTLVKKKKSFCWGSQQLDLFILTVRIVLSKEGEILFFFSMISTQILGLALYSWLGSHLILICPLFLGEYTILIALNYALDFGDTAIWESGIWKTYKKDI